MPISEADDFEVTITDGLPEIEKSSGSTVSKAFEPLPDALSAEQGAYVPLSDIDHGKNVVSIAELGNIQTLHRELDKVKDDDFKKGDSILGRYNVISALSKGATGPVFKCFDTLGGINIAVKCLPRDIVCNEPFLQDVVAAYSKAATLRHTNITGFRTTGRNQRTKGFYIVRDIAEGEDLRLWIHAHAEPEFEAQKLSHVKQLAEALDYAHSLSVVHGDIRPTNIIILSDWHAELMNFGISHAIHAGMSKYGIPQYGRESALPYQAPEVVAGAMPTSFSDQYSLAAVAYTAFAGTPPFSGNDLTLLKKAIHEDVPPPLANVSPHIAAAIAKALSKNPEDRFASCSEFAAAICNTQKKKGSMSFLADLPPLALIGVGFALGALFATVAMLVL